MVCFIKSSSTVDEVAIDRNYAEMKKELCAAADFLAGLLSKHQGDSQKLSAKQIEVFKGTFVRHAFRKYNGHWYLDSPTRGSGFRCIRINGALDPILEKCFIEMHLDRRRFRSLFPAEVTVWVDPGEVCMRIGESGSVCNIMKTGSTSPTNSPVVSPTKLNTSPPPIIPSPIKEKYSLSSVSSVSSSESSSISPSSSPPSCNLFPVFQSQSSSPVHMSFHQQPNYSMLMSCKDALRRHDILNPMERMFVAG